MKKGIRAKICAPAAAAALLIGSGLVGLASAQEPDLATLVSQGATVYIDNCAACHGPAGKGTGNAPGLDGNAFVADRSAVINQVLFGNVEHGMPPFEEVLSDDDIAAVATYVRNSWANDYGVVYPRSVELRRP